MTPHQIESLIPPSRPINWARSDYVRHRDLRKLGIFHPTEIARGDTEEIIAKLELHHSAMVKAGQDRDYWRCNSHLFALKIALAGERLRLEEQS